MLKKNAGRGFALLAASAITVAGLAATTAGTAAAAPGKGDSAATTSATTAKPPVRTGRAGLSSHDAGVSAQLHPKDGICEQYSNGYGDLCLFWGYNYSGSMTDFFRNDANLSDDVFLSAGIGQGSVVGNNSESAYNADAYTTVHVCTEQGFYGSCGFISPSSGGNFNSTFVLDVDSLRWAD